MSEEKPELYVSSEIEIDKHSYRLRTTITYDNAKLSSIVYCKNNLFTIYSVISKYPLGLNMQPLSTVSSRNNNKTD